MSETDNVETLNGHAPPIDDIKTPDDMSASTFPEGGLQAWLTVLGTWFCAFCVFGYVQAFGVYQDFYTRIYLPNKSASDISWIGSIQIFFLFAIALPAGILFDLGYFKHTMVFGTLLLCFSHFMLSLAKEGQYYQVFLSQGVGMGIALGLLWLPSISIVAHWFQRRRILAMGITSSGSSCGGIVFPIMLNRLFHNPSVGFAWGVRAAAFLMLGLLSIATVLMKTRLPNRKEREARGEKSEKPDLKYLMTDSAFLIGSVAAFVTTLGLWFPVFYLQLFAVTHGVNSTVSFYSLAIQNAASVFGRTIPNFYADKYGPYNILALCSLATGGLIFAMFGATTPGGVIAFAILYGFFSGTFLSMVIPATISLARSVNEIGLRAGMGLFIVSIAALIGNPINGAFIGSHFRWERAIIWSGVLVLVGTIATGFARRIATQRKGTQLV